MNRKRMCLPAFSLMETSMTLALTGMLVSILFLILNAANNQLNEERISKQVINDFEESRYSLTSRMLTYDSIQVFENSFVLYDGLTESIFRIKEDQLVVENDDELECLYSSKCLSFQRIRKQGVDFLNIEFDINSSGIIFSYPLLGSRRNQIDNYFNNVYGEDGKN